MGTIADLKTMLGKATANDSATVSVPGLTAVSVSADALYDALPGQFTPVTMYCTAEDGLRIRARPSKIAATLGALEYKQSVIITGLKQVGDQIEWWPVQSGAIKGFSAAQYLTPVPFPSPAPAGLSKVGAHLMGSLTDAEIRGALNLRAAIYKIVDDVGLAQRIHAAQPDAVIIFRRYKPDGYWLNVTRERGVQAAVAQYFSERGYDLDALPFAWHESDNEIDAPDQYIAFEAERCLQMTARGRKACVLNIATGKTDRAMWERCRGLLAAVVAGKHIVGIHGYAQSVMSNNYGTSYVDSSGKWNGELFPTAPSREAWTALRVRRDIADVSEMGFPTVKFAITESGLDDLSKPGNGIYYLLGRKTQAWQTCKDVWRDAGLLVGRTAEQFYRQQLDWYAARLGELPNVVGAVIFNHGFTQDERWRPFDTRTVFL